MPRFAIRVTWANGVDEYLKEGQRPAKFNNRREADEQVSFMRIGMDGDGDIQAIAVVPYPSRGDE